MIVLDPRNYGYYGNQALCNLGAINFYVRILVDQGNIKNQQESDFSKMSANIEKQLVGWMNKLSTES